MFRKKRLPGPLFRMPGMPLAPIKGEPSPLGRPARKGTTLATFQVVGNDTHDNYIACRGYEAETDQDFVFLHETPPINVAKPYAVRGTFPYKIGQVLVAARIHTSLGENQGKASSSVGQPASLSEQIVLLVDDSGVAISWLDISTAPSSIDDHYAWMIGFTISGTSGGLMRDHTFVGGGMKATLDYIVDGDTPPLDGNEEIIVYDDQDMAPLAIRNCKGWATRNEHLQTTENPRYQVISCDQMAMQCRAILDGTLNFTTFEVPIRSIQPDSEQPMGALPIEPYSTFALNPNNHQAKNGSQVMLRWGSAFATSGGLGGVPRQGYIVESVDQWGVYQPVAFRVNQTTKAIEVRWVLASTEISETDFDNLPWEPMFPHKNC